MATIIHMQSTDESLKELQFLFAWMYYFLGKSIGLLSEPPGHI
jgi:hypothetical protein